MPIRHQKVKTVPASRSASIGKGGWVLIGASGIALGAVFHAVAGVAEIAKEMLRREPRAVQGEGRSSPTAAPARPHEAAGWVLIAAATVVVTGLSHAIANLAELARELLGAKPHDTQE
ncbi:MULTISPECIES: hypothetical protein [unclassified Streptomyces]|uniref:hypothetical protein n=1 Tax=unclassified Streptomyces TaxID=2593676 RepID=UPI0034477949